MPLIDKPLSELQHYYGNSPKPHDFEDFWDRSIEEMRSLDPKVDLAPADVLKVPGVECFDLWFDGVGGSRIHAKYLRPANKPEPHPAVLQFHGYSGSAGDWHDKLNYVFAGYSVASLDCRGQAGRSQDLGGTVGNTLKGHIIRGLDDAPEKMLFRQIFLDTAELARIVMSFSEVDEKRVGAMGGSQGGALTLACAALEPRVKRAASVFPFLSDYQRVWEMDQAKDAYAELKEYFRNFDPQHLREREIFTKLGYIDIQNLAPRIEAEVMMFTGLMDTVCPPSTQFAAYNKIESKKQVKIFPDFGHEGLPGHADMIYNFMMGL
jgi:cephalosporin-C deacetylase